MIAVERAVPEAGAIDRGEDPRPDGVADRVVDGVAEDRRDDQQRDQNPDVERPRGRERAAANSSESPGRNGVTTRPVSAKMIRKSAA